MGKLGKPRFTQAEKRSVREAGLELIENAQTPEGTNFSPEFSGRLAIKWSWLKHSELRAGKSIISSLGGVLVEITPITGIDGPDNGAGDREPAEPILPNDNLRAEA